MTTGTHEYKSDFAQRYVAQGKAEGEAEGKVEGEATGKAHAILRVLEARGMTPTPETRNRITNCTDTSQLDTWIHRAATIDTVDDLFT